MERFLMISFALKNKLKKYKLKRPLDISREI